MRARWTCVIAIVLVFACNSCSSPGDKLPSVSSSPRASDSSASSSPTRSSASPSVPSEMASYSTGERRAYLDALQAYRTYSAREAAFERNATAPLAARRFYRDYTADWLSFWQLRKRLAAQGIRVTGQSRVVSSRPVLVRLGKKGTGSVRIRQCIDARKVTVTQRGVPVPQNRTPTISTISMSRLSSDARWKFLIAKAGRSC